MSGRGLGAIGKPGREVVKDPRILDQVRPRPQRLRGADCEPLLEETDKTEPVVRRLVPVPKALRGEGSEQQRQRLVCQGGIRSACPGGPVPHLPPPCESRARQGSLGRRARFRVALRVSTHHVRPRPQAGTFGQVPRQGRGPRSRDGAAATSQPAHPCWGAGQNGPTQLLPAPWGRKRSAPAGARGRRRPFHTRPGILLFLTAHQGKA